MHDQLQKAINLAKKTGDRLIVFDSSKPENVFVVMSLKDYESLILGRSEVKNLTEDELLDKINRDIAIWKSEQDMEQVFEKIDKIPNVIEQAEIERKEQREEDFCWLPDDNKKTKKGWSIPSARKQHAEEVIEEDRQYLEEILF
ncbi:MAG: hypothetical protein AAB653_01535 [Patescibacteria group bacterium]